jgi:hypothetical protein
LNDNFKEFEKFILSFKDETIINIRIKVSSTTGIEILSARKEDNVYLSHLGNSEDSPLTKIYTDKFVDAYGRLAQKGRKK